MEVLSYHSSTENRQQIIPAMLQKAKRVSGVSKITSEILPFGRSREELDTGYYRKNQNGKHGQ